MLGADATDAEIDACVAVLRRTYPRIQVVSRSSLAAYDSDIGWYAYRDGSPLAAD
jgi:hypothetical protein